MTINNELKLRRGRVRKIVFIFLLIFFAFPFSSFADEPTMKTSVICIPEINFLRLDTFTLYTNVRNRQLQEIAFDEKGDLRKKYNLIDEKDSKPFECKMSDKIFKVQVKHHFNNDNYSMSAELNVWLNDKLIIHLLPFIHGVGSGYNYISHTFTFDERDCDKELDKCSKELHFTFSSGDEHTVRILKKDNEDIKIGIEEIQKITSQTYPELYSKINNGEKKCQQ